MYNTFLEMHEESKKHLGESIELAGAEVEYMDYLAQEITRRDKLLKEYERLIEQYADEETTHRIYDGMLDFVKSQVFAEVQRWFAEDEDEDDEDDE